MKITINAEADYGDSKQDLLFTNETLDNNNYVDMVVDGAEYTILVSDLEAVVAAFDVKKHNK